MRSQANSGNRTTLTKVFMMGYVTRIGSSAMAWLDSFPDLVRLEPWAQDRLGRAAVLRPEAGAVLFTLGDPCNHFLFVAEGSARVRLTAESGREIVLYRIVPGETCLLTTAGILGGDAYCAEGVAEAGLVAAALPVGLFEELLDRSAGFRRFVFTTFGHRLTGLLEVVQEVGFGRIDQRLARHLLVRAVGGALAVTHQEIAAELGTAREVVSRQLKLFEREGWVTQARGVVELRNRAALEDVAARG
jgi:CRP/FNR family transcriptional regulator